MNKKHILEIFFFLILDNIVLGISIAITMVGVILIIAPIVMYRYVQYHIYVQGVFNAMFEKESGRWKSILQKMQVQFMQLNLCDGV